MKASNILILIIVLVIAGAAWWLYGNNKNDTNPNPVITSFAECAAAGYPIAESYPEQCRTPDGRVFVREIGNENDKSDLIRVDSPRPGETVSSPLTITGAARGFWYFEASFPVEIRDEAGNILVQAPVQAQGEWMTEEFVPFAATLDFTLPSSGAGELILRKDNPSSLPANDDELVIPIVFATTTAN